MEERRTKVTHVRINEDELEQFKRAAARLGVKPSRLHRKLIREASGCGPDLLKDEMEPVRNAARQLGAIGRNLNQITRKVNSGELAVGFDVKLITELVEYVHAATDSVREVVRRSGDRWVPTNDE